MPRSPTRPSYAESAALSAKNIDDSFSLAIVHMAMGEKEEAFKHLTDAYNERTGQMTFIKYAWWFQSLHGDPRFEELVRKVGFPVIPDPKKGQDRWRAARASWT